MSVSLSVQERLDLIAASGWWIAYDGCHKAYFLTNKRHRKDAEELGYAIYPSDQVEELYRKSCGLQFVSRWGLADNNFEHKWNINQFEEG